MSARAMIRRTGSRRGPWLVALVLALVLGGCRDATEPTGTDMLEKVNRDLPRQLTYSPDDDRSPTWSQDGRFVIYTAPGLPPFAETNGVLFRIPAVGGDAQVVLPEVQFPSGVDHWFTTPVLAPDGDRLAYAEMWSVSTGEMCPGAATVQCTPAGADSRGPRLRDVIFRIREPGSTTAIESDPSVEVSFEGVTRVPQPPGAVPPNLFEVVMYPFHQLYNQEGSLVFRPSWSPDGRRVVLSDGLRLLVWDVDTDQVSPIPGTSDGVDPAWSPDGEWIAFTWLDRGEPIQATCDHYTPFGPACRQLRTVYPVEGRWIALVRPDGSESTVVVEGEEPAWTPDSNRLVFRQGGRLVVASVNGGAVVELSGSEGGREPAVSPDGSLVAFAKRGGLSYDVWVTRLDEEIQ